MREKALVFGSHRGLAGVTCEPDGGAFLGAPAVVMSNVGLNHHVGPGRCWVELARVLAAAGYPSLRFDLSGLGDSRPRRDTRSETERAAGDLSEALDALAGRSLAQRFVLVGNCSGVDNLHVVARSDPRVAGAVYLDGYAYRNRGYAWRRLRRPLELARWRRYLGRLRNARQRDRDDPEAVQLWTRDLPSRAQFASDLRGLVERDVRLLFVFTGGMDQHYNYRGQFHDSFGYREAVDVEFYPRLDHLLSLAAHRAAFNARVRDWLLRHFPPAAR